MADQSSVFFVNGVRIPIVQELSNKISSSDAQETEEVTAQLRRYCRSQDERPGFCLNEQSTGNVLPVIDMSVLLQDSRREMSKLAAACRDWGFFQVVNHGIPLQLLGRMREISRTFFELPLAEKLKYSSASKGISDGYGQAFVFSEEQPLDWGDAFNLHLLPKDKRNLHLWPNSPPDFRETLDSYADRTEELIVRLMELFAENLRLKPDTRLIDEFSSRTLSVRMNYYPPCPRPDLALGLSPHTDGSIVTVLLQDDESEGLQIKTMDHQWLTVKSIPEALVVNIGDTLEVMTNGLYKSVEHRAVTNMNNCRLSIAAFYNPSSLEMVGPIPELIDEEHPPSYRKFKRSDFAKHYFGSRLQGRRHSLDFIKIAHFS